MEKLRLKELEPELLLWHLLWYKLHVLRFHWRKNRGKLKYMITRGKLIKGFFFDLTRKIGKYNNIMINNCRGQMIRVYQRDKS